MKAVKMIMRVVLLPLIAVLWVVDVLANLLLTLGSYVIGPLMFFILCCGIYTVVKQLWNQTLLLILMEGFCVLVFFGTGWFMIMLEDVKEKLVDYTRA